MPLQELWLQRPAPSTEHTLEEMSRNLSTTWIDYKKAFNSVPHTWILKSLKLYQICPTITRFARENMKSWKTILHQTTIRE